MITPVKINFKIYQGTTFTEVLRWESHLKTYVSITDIPKAAPTVVTAPLHGLPVGWRTKVTHVVGMREINSSDTYYIVTDSTPNTVTFNSVNSLGYTTYASGGVLEYNTPEDLTGYTARAQFRGNITDELPIIELTTENGGITIDPVLYTITLNISATSTAGLSIERSIYSLEMEKAGVVITLSTGSASLEKEVTRN